VFHKALCTIDNEFWGIPRPLVTIVEQCQAGATEVNTQIGMLLVEALSKLRRRSDDQYARWIERLTEAIEPRVTVCRTCGRELPKNITPRRAPSVLARDQAALARWTATDKREP
jgi:hypothetical protein